MLEKCPTGCMMPGTGPRSANEPSSNELVSSLLGPGPRARDKLKPNLIFNQVCWRLGELNLSSIEARTRLSSARESLLMSLVGVVECHATVII